MYIHIAWIPNILLLDTRDLRTFKADDGMATLQLLEEARDDPRSSQAWLRYLKRVHTQRQSSLTRNIRAYDSSRREGRYRRDRC